MTSERHRSAPRRPVGGLVAAAVALSLAACAGADAATGDAPDDAPVSAPIAGACAPEAPDCVDTVIGDPDPDLDARRAAAQALIGAAEGDLDPAVRIARRGDEGFMLTEDHVPGRMTVELDDEAGVFRVTVVVLEVPDGVDTFSR